MDQDLSVEDRELKERLDLYVERIKDVDVQIAALALEQLKEETRTSTSSMTSVPKPLKFLNPHYSSIKDFYQTVTDAKLKVKKAQQHYYEDECIFFSRLLSREPEREQKRGSKKKKGCKKKKKTSKTIFFFNIKKMFFLLAMTMEDPTTRACLKYRLESDLSQIETWGAQYVKHLAAEVRQEMLDRLKAERRQSPIFFFFVLQKKKKKKKKKNLECRSRKCWCSFMCHITVEPDACDLLLEVEQLPMISQFFQLENHARVCEYLRSCAPYHPYPEDVEIYRTCFELYFKFKSYYHALRYALRLDDHKLVKRVMKATKHDKVQSRQLALNNQTLTINFYFFILFFPPLLLLMYNTTIIATTQINNFKGRRGGRRRRRRSRSRGTEDNDDDEMPDVNEIISNAQLSEAFRNLAKDLDVLDPKDPQTDIFKEQLLEDAATNSAISARKSLAISYVNAFVNAGFGLDKLMSVDTQTANNWLGKNKERGQMAAVASVGSLMLWDENAVNTVDRYFESDKPCIRAGAFLAIGMACSGMRNDAGLGYALLAKPIKGGEKKRGKEITTEERVAAAFGLGLAYAGQANAAVYEVLSNVVSKDSPEENCPAWHHWHWVCNLILTDLMERVESQPEKLNDSLYLLNALGLGLLFLQRNEEVDTTLEAVSVFNDMNEKFAQTLRVTLEVMAYAGSGNVIKVQQFLEMVGQHYDNETEKDKDKDKDKEKEKDKPQTSTGSKNANANNPFAAMLGASGAQGAGAEEEGEDEKKEEEDDKRYFQTIAVLGIAMIAMGEELGSDMALRMFDHLIQYGNIRVKRAVPLALGLLCVSNPRMEVSDVLSKLSHDHNSVVSQSAILSLGLISAGTNNARVADMLRGLTSYYSKDANHLYLDYWTIQPYHSDRLLLSKVALAGVLCVVFAAIDLKNSLLSSRHWLLYSLITSIKPRMLATLDEKLKSLKTNVRVGQALDVVAQAGRPKSITGFQTHDTPVLLGYKDRAELASDEYISFASVLEGFAILRKNPDAEKGQQKKTDTN
ncbi:hypothetical protein RFI_31903 [Reticulomyxa filosa]|uniref:26S proteasome non-ATPase regulatory subunit 2 n=1 Tax=Reticulomyxa filosa TaxID=46433 RepID=X6LV61_RETFI|nr:hypothetical protein RFI_31903 [Reticulomyxa filosa]|eukprot:ETO05494.1 hypothetical protein RFI_31903 [Reticulomyxa filosa]